ncbi:hypothetical protein D3C81_1505180 [compost metagenome]
MLAAADPAAQLMQLRQAKTVSVHDDHQCGVRDIYPDLHDSSGDEQLNLIAIEGPHDLIFLRRGHPSVEQTHLVAREGLRHLHMQIDSILHIQLL